MSLDKLRWMMGGDCECRYLKPLPTCDRIDNFISTGNWSPAVAAAARVSSNCYNEVTPLPYLVLIRDGQCMPTKQTKFG